MPLQQEKPKLYEREEKRVLDTYSYTSTRQYFKILCRELIVLCMIGTEERK